MLRRSTCELQTRLHAPSEEGREETQGDTACQKSEGTASIIQEDPYADPPPFEALVGDLKGTFSRRINIQHRLVYQVFDDERVIKVIRLWTHYE